MVERGIAGGARRPRVHDTSCVFEELLQDVGAKIFGLCSTLSLQFTIFIISVLRRSTSESTEQKAVSGGVWYLPHWDGRTENTIPRGEPVVSNAYF